MDTRELCNLIDECHKRGVLHLRLADGTEFHLNPGHVARHSEQSLPKQGAQATMVTGTPIDASKRNPITDDIDTELFGKPLDEAE